MTYRKAFSFVKNDLFDVQIISERSGLVADRASDPSWIVLLQWFHFYWFSTGGGGVSKGNNMVANEKGG